MSKNISRREFVKGAAAGIAALGLLGACGAPDSPSSAPGSNPGPGPSSSPSPGTSPAGGTYIPGTYSAQAQGMGTIVVTMTFSADAITNVELDLSKETDTIGQAAAQTLIDQLMNKQTVEIDGVSGATITTDAVKKAAAECIAQAKGLAAAPGGSGADAELPQVITGAELAASTCEIGEIKGAQDGGEYDVIVIGAGTGGVPCAVKACQDGAKVLLLQKEPTPVGQGNSGSGILVDESDPMAVWYLIQDTMKNCSWRSDLEQLKTYVYRSGEAMEWYYKEAVASGYPAQRNPNKKEFPGYGTLSYIGVRDTGKPHNVGTVITSIANAYAGKMDIRYSTPAVQLIKEGGRVTGVYAKDEAGTYYRFTAKKGVVLATGDYQNNDAMVEKYCPDVLYFGKKQYHKTGDGHLMGLAVGAKMEPVGHTKMLHDFDSGLMFNEPFLRVDMYGKRFHNENVDMSIVNNYMRGYEAGKAGKYCQIFDADYFEQAKEWGGSPVPETAMTNYMPEAEIEHKGVFVDLLGTYKADTLDELAGKLGIPADALKATVARYNELAEQGFDADFGKNAKYMKKIEKAPFWGIRKSLRVSALCSGLLITNDFEVLDEEMKPIEGLYAIGNCSGAFYGCIDYPLHFGGMSIGRCITAGYLLGGALAAK